MGKKQPIVIVDYGLGNLFSIKRALEHLGAEAATSADPAVVASAKKLILPGVGSFGDGMRGLTENGLVEPIREFAGNGRPILGICLGMQLLLDEGVEFGVHQGLGLVPGATTPFPRANGGKMKIPHVGWNCLAPAGRMTGARSAWRNTILSGLKDHPYVYFVHSFIAVPKNESDRLAMTSYGGHSFCSVLRSGRVSGCQFHPEKSGPMGLKILANFLEA